MEAKGLNERERLFCLEYIKDLNGVQAAKRAGYAEAGAGVQATRLLKKANVASYIGELKEARNKRLEIDADTVIKELAKIGLADIADYVDISSSGVKIKDFKKIKHTSVVSSVSETTYEDKTTVTLKMHDKVKALELLGKHTGIFDDAGKAKPNEDKNVTVNIIQVQHRRKGEVIETKTIKTK